MADIANPDSLYAKLQQQFHSQLRSLSNKQHKENEELSKNNMDAEYHAVSSCILCTIQNSTLLSLGVYEGAAEIDDQATKEDGESRQEEQEKRKKGGEEKEREDGEDGEEGEEG